MPEPPMTPSTDLVMMRPIMACPLIGTCHRFLSGACSLPANRQPTSPEHALPRAMPASRVNRAPHLLLCEVKQARQHDQEDHDLHAHALARLEVRLGRPGQERG